MYKRQEFESSLGGEQIAALKRYFVFGSANHRYEDRTFFVFTASGQLGVVRYEHDFGPDEWAAEFLPLCAGRMASLSIDEVLGPPVRACTADLQKRLATNSW